MCINLNGVRKEPMDFAFWKKLDRKVRSGKEFYGTGRFFEILFFNVKSFKKL